MKRKIRCLLLSLVCASLCHAYEPELPVEAPLITAGRFFLNPVEYPMLVQKISATDLTGLFIAGDQAFLLPVTSARVKIENIKKQVDIRLPDSIRVNKKFIQNKKSRVKYQYARLLHSPMPVVFLSLPDRPYGEIPVAVNQCVELPVNGTYTFCYEEAEYEMTHAAELRPHEYPSNIRITIRNVTTGQEQLLSVRDQMRSTRSYLIFAGDVDGDGKLDLILDESPKAHHGHLTLYLSSAAREEEMVRLVAEEFNSEDPPYDQLMRIP